ncbi:MAG: DUF424 domain-containing protein [Methanomicrobiales archaeon]|nr:DUF424 domain-containing protein [Methanomicrobiales archaeon]
MLLRIHRSAENHEVVGICDRELVGKTLNDGDLSITITSSFFGDDPVSEEEVIRVLQTSDNITIYGERSISLAVTQGLIDKNSCRFVAGVPFATIIRL